MERTYEKSKEQADIIAMMGLYVPMLDEEYIRSASNDMLNQAYRQESMAVLNPRHPQSKNDLLRQQGVALRALCDYIKALKECNRLKLQIEKEGDAQKEIDKLFL